MSQKSKSIKKTTSKENDNFVRIEIRSKKNIISLTKDKQNTHIIISVSPNCKNTDIHKKKFYFTDFISIDELFFSNFKRKINLIFKYLGRLFMSNFYSINYNIKKDDNLTLTLFCLNENKSRPIGIILPKLKPKKKKICDNFNIIIENNINVDSYNNEKELPINICPAPISILTKKPNPNDSYNVFYYKTKTKSIEYFIYVYLNEYKEKNYKEVAFKLIEKENDKDCIEYNAYLNLVDFLKLSESYFSLFNYSIEDIFDDLLIIFANRNYKIDRHNKIRLWISIFNIRKKMTDPYYQVSIYFQQQEREKKREENEINNKINSYFNEIVKYVGNHKDKRIEKLIENPNKDIYLKEININNDKNIIKNHNNIDIVDNNIIINKNDLLSNYDVDEDLANDNDNIENRNLLSNSNDDNSSKDSNNKSNNIIDESKNNILIIIENNNFYNQEQKNESLCMVNNNTSLNEDNKENEKIINNQDNNINYNNNEKENLDEKNFFIKDKNNKNESLLRHKRNPDDNFFNLIFNRNVYNSYLLYFSMNGTFHTRKRIAKNRTLLNDNQLQLIIDKLEKNNQEFRHVNLQIHLKIIYEININTIGDDNSQNIINEFYEKSNNINNLIFLIKTKKNKLFGGFTEIGFKLKLDTLQVNSDKENKNIFNYYDPNSFVFSIDRMKIFDIGEENVDCIFCNSASLPEFKNQIYFDKNNLIFGYTGNKKKGYLVDEDYELNNGEKKFEISHIQLINIYED